MAGLDLWAGFMIFNDDYERLRFLPDAQKLAVIDAVFRYSKTGCVEDMGDMTVNIVYDIMIKAVDRARAKSINAKLGRAKKKEHEEQKSAAHMSGDCSNLLDSADFCSHLLNSAHGCSDALDSAQQRSNLVIQSKGKADTKSKADTDADASDHTALCLQKVPGMTPTDFKTVCDFLESGMTDESVQYAVDTAVRKGKLNFGFVRHLLNEWFINEVRTADAAKEYERKKYGRVEEPEPNRYPPQWTGKKYEDDD